MPWLALAGIAAGLLSKEAERQRAKKEASNQTLLDVGHARTAQLGGSPYSAMGDNLIMKDRAIDRAANSSSNLLGSALQAYSAIGSGVGDSGETLSSLGSDRSVAEGLGETAGAAPASALSPLSAGPEAAGSSAVTTLFDELNKKDPWER